MKFKNIPSFSFKGLIFFYLLSISWTGCFCAFPPTSVQKTLDLEIVTIEYISSLNQFTCSVKNNGLSPVQNVTLQWENNGKKADEKSLAELKNLMKDGQVWNAIEPGTTANCSFEINWKDETQVSFTFTVYCKGQATTKRVYQLDKPQPNTADVQNANQLLSTKRNDRYLFYYIQTAVLNNDLSKLKELLKPVASDFKNYLDKYEDPNIQLLFSALDYKNTSMVELLLNYGVEIEKEYNGNTPIARAVFNNDVDTVRFLLSRKANPNVTCNWFSKSILLHAINEGYIDIATLLIEDARTDFNIKDSFTGYSAFLLAISKAELALVKLMVEEHASRININQKDRYGDSALNIAVRKNNLEIVTLLLKMKNIALDFLGHCGFTPLYWAVMQQNKEIVAELLKAGADKNIQLDGKKIICHAQLKFDKLKEKPSVTPEEKKATQIAQDIIDLLT